MLRCVTLVRTDISGESSASIIRVTRFGELGRTLGELATDAPYEEIMCIGSFHLEDEGDSDFGTSILTRATRRHIPEDGILHSHRRENLKPYIALTGWAL
jgi:hypothetical protein